MPPLMVNEASGFGTGQLPDKEGQMYHVTLDNYYLIPTAEVPVTNIYRDVILDESDFPIKMTAYTPCFRREAGSYGKDVRGLNRLHQFDKVEIVQLAHPDRSYEALDGMIAHVESIVQKLELPYRILRLCGGDMKMCIRDRCRCPSGWLRNVCSPFRLSPRSASTFCIPRKSRSIRASSMS